MVAVCGVHQLNHASFLVVDAIVTAFVPTTMIAAQMFHLLLATNTALVSKLSMQMLTSLIDNVVNDCYNIGQMDVVTQKTLSMNALEYITLTATCMHNSCTCI